MGEVTLPDFLLARIAEDEVEIDRRFDFVENWEHMEYAHRRRRALIECAAKRRIVGLCSYETASRVQVRPGVFNRVIRREPTWDNDGLADLVLQEMTAPYRGHPDYDPAWAR